MSDRSLASAIPRCCYVSGLGADWAGMLAGVAGLGFTHVVFAPPFATPDVRLLGDPHTPHPAWAWEGDSAGLLKAIDSASRAAGLGWMLDVRLDAVAAAGAFAAAHPEAFTAPAPWTAIDPDEPEALARVGGDATAAWGGLLEAWVDLGAAGFRFSGLAAMGAERFAKLAARLRPALLIAALDDASLDDAGDRLADWRGAGLDRVELAIDRWDDDARLVLRRAGALAAVAPVLAVVEAPFGPRFAGRFARRAGWLAAAGRAVHLAGAVGDGWMMPHGFASGDTVRMDSRGAGDVPADIPAAVAAAIRAANEPAPPLGPARALPSLAREVDGLIRRGAERARATLVNRSAAAATLRLSDLVQGFATETGMTITLAGGQARSIELIAAPMVRHDRQPRPAGAAEHAATGRLAIESVAPAVDGGRFAAKRVVGDAVTVECDVICDGHDQLAVVLEWRAVDETQWRETRMRLLGNDRWRGGFDLSAIGRWEFRIAAWRDAFATFHDELSKKTRAGLDVTLEVREGRAHIEDAGGAAALARLDAAATLAERVEVLLSPQTVAEMRAADTRPFLTQSADFPIDADRPQAAFASWYEIFPRSMSGDGVRHGTFRDVIEQLPRIRDMGFDVLYFPPIHPIGRLNRKGRNNSLTPAPDDPGSPYAIGSAEGGHDAMHPELGTFADFEDMRREAAAMGLEIAIDFAIQCAPDHPWLAEHKGWFDWRPDGSLRYAENPPKKYEDIVNVDFYAPDAIPDLWVALCDVVFFWLERGVRIFRVDNPHTKPFPFWEWLIGEVRSQYPDAIFLAEAFTRPKVMNRLGKVGFHQSYTYFTWRNTKAELQEYLTQITTDVERDFFRPNFFVNTPDINPVFLQNSGRAGFLIRAALAATLAGSWGVYCGFELCEAAPVPGKEEYLDSEKYQLRAWDWDRPGNIVAEIAQLNAVRRLHPALWSHLGVSFLPSDDEQVMFFEKATADRSDVLLIAICLDPRGAHSAAIELPLWRWGLSDQATIDCRDVLHETDFTLSGKWQRVALSPDAPYTIWHARPQGRGAA